LPVLNVFVFVLPAAIPANAIAKTPTKATTKPPFHACRIRSLLR
jgi:hypothetical protein